MDQYMYGGAKYSQVHFHRRKTKNHTCTSGVVDVGPAKKTYNSRYSLVVTDPTTNQPLSRLTMGERTGSRIFYWVWSYVLCISTNTVYNYTNYNS